MKTVIVGSQYRKILTINKDLTYVYIPLSDEEKNKFAPDTPYACWRIAITT